MNRLPSLPVGTTSFPTMRKFNEICVDKTDLIHELARSRSKVFLARPRRFGKTLLVSTFESLFAHGLRDFQGLAIEKLWTDQTYRVVRLDFSCLREFEDYPDFEAAFAEMLARTFLKHGCAPSSSPLSTLSLSTLRLSALSLWADWLESFEEGSLVLLIDECDAPLTACLDQPELLAKVDRFLSLFFGFIKTHEGVLRFFFMTGVTKIGNAGGIFGGFNSIVDISLDPAYGTLLGFTRDELTDYFSSDLAEAAKVLHLSESELLEQLAAYYGGYSFDQWASTHVFCPWSVIRFLANPKLGFENYWFQSGGQPAVLQKYLRNHPLSDPSCFAKPITIGKEQLSLSSSYENLQLEVLLVQAGYLSIQSATASDFIVDYPNREVALSMARLYAQELLGGRNIERHGGLEISEVLGSASAKDVVEQFNLVFNAIDYKDYPIRDEASCRSHLQVLLLGAAMLPSVETHNAKGRSDLSVVVGRRHWIFEIKFARRGDDPTKLLDMACRQMRDRRYDKVIAGKEVLPVALLFSDEARRIVAWKSL